MQSIIDWTLTGSDGQPIIGNTHRPDREPRGTLIVCHGFKGYKDYGFFPRLCRRAAEAGLIAHRFNFSHSGMTNRVETFEKPGLFEKDTWSKQVADLRTVHVAVTRDDLAYGGGPIFWFGHSRGGVTVLNTAAQATGKDKPGKIVVAATPSGQCRLSDEHIDRLERDGYMLSPSNRTGQTLRVGIDWLNDIRAQGDALNPRVSIAQIDVPTLLIHGEDDPTVPLLEAQELLEASGQRARLVVIPEAQHTFNCPNPLPESDDEPAATKQMFDAALAFLKQ